MRLTTRERTIIVQTIAATFGQEAKLWLFGSRVDDNKRGGDIDLYVETTESSQMLQKRMAVMATLQMQLGDQKIDLLVRSLTEEEKSIHRIAKQTGVRL